MATNQQDNLVDAGEGVKLAVPANWKRNAMVVFGNGQEGDNGASVVVRRETLDPKITLQQYGDGLLIEMARTLPEFALIDRRSRTLGGQPAMEFLYTMSARGVEYEQRQVLTLDVPGSVLSIVVSATKKQARSFQDQWDAIFASVVLSSAAGAKKP